MYKPLLGVIAFLFFFGVKPVYCGCPDSDSFWLKSNSSLKMQFLLEHCNQIDSVCFCSVIETLLARGKKVDPDSMILFVKRWAENNKTSTGLLLKCYRSELIYSARPVWSIIFADWQHDNQTVYHEFDNLIKSGMHSIADTLYSIFDAEGKLEPQDWLRWAKLKALIGDYSKVATLCCRVIQLEPGLSEFTLYQFGLILEDSDSAVSDNMMEQFYKCSLRDPETDTLSIRSWLADTYSKLGFFRQELNIFKVMSASGVSVAARALDAARSRFSRKRFRDAIDAARMSYLNTDRFALKSAAASLIYQSFTKLGEKDSAAQWLNRIDLGSDKNRIEAICFYQNNGDFSNAARLIDTLSVSVARDSLVIRQFILQGNFQKAYDFLSKPKPYIHNDQQSFSLWMARMLLFCSKYDEFTAFIDTLEIAPFWACAAELISYQYWLQFLGNSTESLVAWANIEYNLYCGSFHKVSQILSHYQIPDGHRWKLALHASKSCLKRGQQKEALSLLKNADVKEIAPEFLYFKAEAFYRCGESDSAKLIFNKIMLEHPADLFSEKARVFLTEYGL